MPRPAWRWPADSPLDDEGVKTVASQAELNDLNNRLAQGGTPIRRPGCPGEWIRLPNGQETGLRPASSRGGSTIDFNPKDNGTQEIQIK